MKRKTPRPKKYIIADECTKLWPRACEVLWGDACLLSGDTEQTTFHHYIPKSQSMRLKYDPINGVPLRNGVEHYKIHHGHNPEEVRKICQDIRDKRGKAWCDYIDLRAGMDNRGLFTLKWILKQKENLTKIIETGKINNISN